MNHDLVGVSIEKHREWIVGAQARIAAREEYAARICVLIDAIQTADLERVDKGCGVSSTLVYLRSCGCPDNWLSALENALDCIERSNEGERENIRRLEADIEWMEEVTS